MKGEILNMNTTNSDIRFYAFKNDVKMYQIAEKLNIHYATLNNRLRRNLTKEEKQIISRVIDELKQKQGGKNYAQ